ncbi:T cell receptor alpha chain MC.7.G5-like [Pseudophryne corroboree]|uniref:T cell receptor alpha chain MC.7.G5-like n=1 Tax=Pseudophryne corroboree TaxID=495146 RepID=UPI003081699B
MIQSNSITVIPWVLLLTTVFTDVLSDTQVTQDLYHQITEHQDVTLRCNHSIKNYDLLIWFKHVSGLGLEICAHGLSTATYLIPRYSMTIERDTLITQLHIVNVKGEDTAVYYCAVSGSTWGKLVFGGGTQLNIIPKTDRDRPSVYHLNSSKPVTGVPESVCLITDIPSVKETLLLDNRKLSSEAVLDKSDSDVWRNSIATWNDGDSSQPLHCALKYGGINIVPEYDTAETINTCSSLSIDENFRTSPSMNELSLTVLGLRVVTVKAIVFNLIITLRLWSS